MLTPQPKILIQSGGIFRNVTVEAFESKWKRLGFVGVDEAPTVLTKKEIMERLKEEGVDFDPRQKKDELNDLLKEVVTK